ncbi:MAG: tetratricopeptide repeat protein [Gammaproteobacteria bacterium]|nr:tetratricopeptide repeat protein [Gammaproteobacteria bacterium]
MKAANVIKFTLLWLLTVLVFSAMSSPAMALDEKGGKLLAQAREFLQKNNIAEAKRALELVLQNDSQTAEAYFLLGHVYLRSNDAASSVANFQKAVSLDSKNAVYSLGLGNVYERAGRPDLAIKEYQRLVDSGSRHPAVKAVEKNLAIMTAQSLMSRGEYNAALLILNGLLLEYPDEASILYMIGSVYMQLNRMEDAEQTYLKLLADKPDSVLVNMSLASVYERTGKPEQARKYYWKVVVLDKSPESTRDARIRYGIVSGNFYLEQQRFEEAIAAYDDVQKIAPDNPEPILKKGIAYMQIRKPEKAEQLFAILVKKNEKDFTSRLQLANALGMQQKNKEAKEQLEYIIKNDDGRFRDQAKVRLNLIHTQIADEALRSGNVAEGLAEYQKALEYFSGNVDAAFKAGTILMRQGRLEEAQREFETVLTHMPDALPARMTLAQIYDQRGLYSQAAEQYERVIQIAPDTNEAKFAKQRWPISKARGLWAEQRLLEAEDVLAQELEENSGNTEAYIYLGIIQSARGNARDAVASYQKVMQLQPENQGIRLQLGTAYEQLGMDEMAATEYRKIIFAGATEVVLSQAKARLSDVESRLNGFSESMSYSFQYDDNLNMNDENPVEELRSDLAFNLFFNYKFSDTHAVRLGWSPTYSTYHFSQSDYLNSNLSAGWTVGIPGDSYAIVYSRQDQQGLMNETTVSKSQSLSLARAQRVAMPALFGLTPKRYEGEDGVPTSLQSTLNARTIESFGGVPLESLLVAMGFNMGQLLLGDVQVTVSYNLTVYRNVHNKQVINEARVRDPETNQITDTPVRTLFYDSRDYEYNSHTLGMNLQRALAAGLSGSVGGNVTYTGYVNPDSGAKTRRLLDTRNNYTVSGEAGLFYALTRGVNLFANVSVTRNDSDMPIATLYNNDKDETEQAIASYQSTSLGDYKRLSGTLGMNMAF